MRVVRLLAVLIALVAVLLQSAPVQAAQALPPGQKPGKYVRWYYPSQLPYGTFEDGSSAGAAAGSPAAFLTLPFMGPHIVTSIFDHCGPDYGTHGSVCRYDGVKASASLGGPDPSFTAGFAQTPGGHDYLYYEGHDGYDYALTYEPVAAAADGVVLLADWVVPDCHTCSSGITIEIGHGSLLSYYGHLSQVLVSKGQHVRRGQVVGISGSTGTATGPHLHFGIYSRTRAYTPIDPYGWLGPAPDPYAYDLGNLWLGGSPRYADIPMPKVSVSAVADITDATAVDVSWSSPGDGNVYRMSVVRPDGTMTSWLGQTSAGSAVYHLRPGQRTLFWVSVTTNLGWTDANGSEMVQIPRTNPGQAL